MDNATHALLALIAHHGLSAPLARRLFVTRNALATTQEPEWQPSASAYRRAERQLYVLGTHQIQLVPVWALPERLLRAEPLPPALFVRGAVSLLCRPAVGIVGARRAGRGARQWAKQCAEMAARAEYLVISGGALGVDRAAHEGALAGQGATLAYIGASADRVYPAANRRLFEKVLASGGALVSEHPPLTQTFASAHALRNRFIAAHAKNLLIAEAELDSGSIGTARYAWRYRVPVWVAPPEVGGARGGLDALCAAGEAQLFPGPERFFAAEAFRPVRG